MATSGSTNFNETTYNIIQRAYQKIGVVRLGGQPTGAETEFARDELNRMVKAWMAMGYNLWTTKRETITLVADQASYQLGGSGSPALAERPQRIFDAVWVESTDNEIRMHEMRRQEYWDLPNKSANGAPTNWYYDPGRDTGTLYVWPVPGTSEATSVKFNYQRPFEDFDANDDDPDFPQEWLDALVTNLSYRLHYTFYPQNRGDRQDLQMMAAQALNLAMTYDRPTADMEFMMDSEYFPSDSWP